MLTGRGGRLRTMRVSCYYGKVAIGLDGRPSRPATDGKLSVTGTAATAVRFFSAKGKPLFQPSIQPHTRVLRVLVGKFSHIHRGSRCSVLSVAVRACIPAAVLFSGRNALHRRFLTVVVLPRGKIERSVPHTSTEPLGPQRCRSGR